MNIYKNVEMNVPGRSAFDLSYAKLFNCNMGQLIPVLCDEAIPGDVWEIGQESVIRFAPMIAPLLHDVSMTVHYFFVPNRIIWDDWEDFITGGVDGDLAPVIPTAQGVLNFTRYSLADYFGFPVASLAAPFPIMFPWYAYNLIYNEYYRDETNQDEIDLENNTVLYRNWMKDYFTSALPFQQRGTAPALPISGTTSAVFSGPISGQVLWPAYDATSPFTMVGSIASMKPSDAYTHDTLENNSFSIPKASLDGNVVDLSSATTFDIADLRLAFQIQRWMERNARAGARYTEFLKGHFGVHPRDDRLQRPEYIGGAKTPIIFSEVLQTSSTDATSPQGNLAGHGISVSREFCGKYHVQEFGLIVGIMSIMPRPAYSQGMPRQWMKETKYDYYFPEFAHLSEQQILKGELYASNNENNNKTLFGYQGRYDELRTKNSQVNADFRDIFNYWHLSREFASAPTLGDTFLKMKASDSERIFASSNEPGIYVNWGNRLRVVRPMPIMATPGLIDH